MLQWLTNRNHDARVYMCIKEVKWDLETADPIKRAKILACAISLFQEMRDPEFPLEQLVNRPLDYPRKDLLMIYENLENLRNDCVRQWEHMKKNMGQFGMDLPDFSEQHFKLSRRALEIWMITVGAGIAPNRRDDVREIWKMLTASKSMLEEAIESLFEVEEKTCSLTGQPGGMFSFINPIGWKEACNFVPEQFSKELAAL